LASLFGFLATLTRSAGLLLILPFCYEYLRQHDFNLRAIRFDILAGILIPAGLGIYSLYCYFHFHDALAFSHAQSVWNRHLQPPWQPFFDSLTQIRHNRILSFISVHNVLDLAAISFILLLVILSFIGPWKLPKDRWMYSLFGVGIYIFALIFPTKGIVPLAAFSRYMLEVFPAFIVLAAIGKRPQFNLYYLTISLTLLAFLLLQFLTGYWIV
jgi:hypothetical protein